MQLGHCILRIGCHLSVDIQRRYDAFSETPAQLILLHSVQMHVSSGGGEMSKLDAVSQGQVCLQVAVLRATELQVNLQPRKYIF